MSFVKKPRRRNEVCNWMDVLAPSNTSRQNGSSILLVSGPTGSGKTACIRALAKEMDLQLCEWITPVDQEFQMDSLSQKESFMEFLFKASRYQSLFDTKRRILLVEDFPNVLLYQKDLFADILKNYKTSGKYPLVFIAADTNCKSLDIAYNLFPDSIKQEFRIHHVPFNAISNTLLKKAMNQIMPVLKREFQDQFQEPSASILDSIITSSQGDIRNAILNLQFVSQKNLPPVQLERVTELSNKELARKRPKKEPSQLKEIGRDGSITLMHGLGRVFNPKFDVAGKLTHSPESLTDIFITQPQSFLSLMFSNYLGHLSSIEDCQEMGKHLTLGDFLLAEYRETAMTVLGLNVAIRGAMLSSGQPVIGRIPFKGYKMDKATENGVSESYHKFVANGDQVRNLITRNVFVLDTKDYIVVIKGTARSRGGDANASDDDDNDDGRGWDLIESGSE